MTLLDHTPHFTPAGAARFARRYYALDAGATPLPSERDQNFLLTTGSGERYVLKIANALEDEALLRAQQAAMARVAAHIGLCPAVVPTPTGATLIPVDGPEGESHFLWLVTYLPGTLLADVPHHSADLLADLGDKLGQVDGILATFDHPAIHRDFHWDLAHGLHILQRHLDEVGEPALRDQITTFIVEFEEAIAPQLAGLRRSAIHNDANDYNVLVHRGNDPTAGYQTVAGLVDFGDMVYSHTVNEPAVAIAYAILDKDDPLAAAAALCRGYHGAYPLQEAEVAVLWDLACLRLCVSIVLAAHQQAQRPGDPYLAVSQQPIRRAIRHLLDVPRALATAHLRHACGWEPSPVARSVAGWLHEDGAAARILDDRFFQAPPHVLDLGVASPLFESDPEKVDAAVLERKITRKTAARGAAFAIGRYDEVRLLQARANPAGPPPALHLGLDLFVPAGTHVYAPFDGTVFALTSEGAPVANSPAVLLRHESAAGHTFCTRFGGLSVAAVAALRPGQPVRRGEPFAAVGPRRSGDPLPPHLHLQLIADDLDLGAAFPSFVSASGRDFWRQLSPDPNLILGLPKHPFPPPPQDKDETFTVRRRHFGGNLTLSYREPLKIVRGWMQYLYDESGRRYLDAYNNVPHVGHCHPRVVAAGRQQMGLLNTNTRYLHDLVNEFAERLTATLPEPLRVCYFVNSGSEANELALRLARTHTGQRDVLVLEAAYHGHTNTLIDISPYKHDGPGGSGAPPWVHAAPLPDLYRGPYRAGDPEAAHKYARHVAETVAALQEEGRAPAAFIAETLPSVGGQIVLPDGYLAAVYDAVRTAGGVCIADEVQTAYGRIGSHFYGFEAHDVVPDIVVLGKPIGNGHPLAAVVTTPTIAASFANGMEFFSTFGGNTVSCAVGLAVLQVVQEESLQAHALRVGDHLLRGLRPLVDRYPLVGDVRGSGLFLGVELVRDPDTRAPAGAAATHIANQMRRRGILIGTDGPDHNVLKIRPPMPFTTADADQLLATLEGILTAGESS